VTGSGAKISGETRAKLKTILSHKKSLRGWLFQKILANIDLTGKEGPHLVAMFIGEKRTKFAESWVATSGTFETSRLLMLG